MLLPVLLCLPLAIPKTLEPTSEVASASTAPGQVEGFTDEEYKRRRKEAGKDVEKLWDVYLWCDAYGKSRQSRSVLSRIVKLEPNYRPAREALGHLEHEGQWFESEEELEAYVKEQEERLAKEQGLVRHEDEWVPAEDLPYLKAGLVRTEDGDWVTQEELERLEAGWRRQDLVWIPPEEVPKIEEGLWKCGDEWLPLPEANEYHSSPDTMWVLPTYHYVLRTTLRRDIAEEAREQIDRTHRDLVEIYGVAPQQPPTVIVLRDAEQYGEFASGTQQRPGTELLGLSSIHYAYFADAGFDPKTREFLGAGVAFWDASTEAGKAYGIHAVRHAAGQAFGEAVDPSAEALAEFEASERQEFDPEAMLEGKRVPRWFRYGAASYVERYFIDNLVERGGNPRWARDWALSNLRRRGGLSGLDRIFELRLSAGDPEGSEKLISEAGLLIAFALDGGVEAVEDAHRGFTEALAGDDAKAVQRTAEALEKEIAKHEEALREFADL